MVLIYAILVALPVYYVGRKTKDSTMLAVAAIVMIIIAAITGNPRYFSTDLGVILAVWLFAYVNLKDWKRRDK